MKNFESESYIYAKKTPNHNSVIQVKNVPIGGKNLVIMAGPCVIDDEKTTDAIAKQAISLGANVLRGGAYKPRTSPYSFQGVGESALDTLHTVGLRYDIPVISEILGIGQIEKMLNCVDIFQVGARNMQNYELLKALGRTDKPILLKRGFANTIEEFLFSAEYILKEGNTKVILCERGIRTFEDFTRNTLDISAVPILKRLTHLPVVVDPSHASGIHWLVKPLSLAAIAAGADGLIIEVHTNPHASACDPEHTLTMESFSQLMTALKPVAQAVGRDVSL